MGKQKRYAVVDIGTLKVKTQIVSVREGLHTETLYTSNTLTCLGVRMHENNNRPHETYLQQTIAELRRCKTLFEQQGVVKVRIVSTHALREMGSTGYEIAARIKKETGLSIEIISQQEEASLFFNAVIRDFETTDDLTVIDVGGGSVQLLTGNKQELKHAYLLKSGAQYLTDHFSPRHTEQDFPTRDEIRAMQAYILEQLTPLPEKSKTPVVYGSSCIIDVFKALPIALNKYSLSLNHPYQVNPKELEEFMRHLHPIPYGEREKRYPTPLPYYMWQLDLALLNVLSVCKKVEAPYVIPSNVNINQGLILQLTAS